MRCQIQNMHFLCYLKKENSKWQINSCIQLWLLPNNQSKWTVSPCYNYRYKSDHAAVKALGDIQVKATDRRILMEIKTMQDINHDNVNAFLGICFETPHACILMSYASRGSLQDILAKDEMTLTVDFQISFITDIAEGMKVLHANVPGKHNFNIRMWLSSSAFKPPLNIGFDFQSGLCWKHLSSSPYC